MRNRFRTWILCGLVFASFSAPGWAQTSGRTYHWLGDAGGDVTNPANWLDLPDPDSGTVPGPLDFIELRWGDRPPVTLEYGAANATYEHVIFNHADVGTTINGTGTLTFARPLAGPTNIDVKTIESQGGHRVSTINANVNSLGLIEARNGHDLVFNGSVTVPTVHAYIDDDQVTTSDVTFNGDFTHTGYNEAKFMTGTGTVRFNGNVTLDHTEFDGGFGIRNGMTMILGQGFSAIRLLPGGGVGPGLDVVDMYNNSKVKLEGDSVVGGNTRLFSRANGSNDTNTLDLNGHSDSVEFLGTHPGATFVIDFGATPGANSFLWETTHHHVGNYNIKNFEIGVDTLTLGNVGSSWWTVLDTETDGGGSSNTEVDKSHMTIDGLPYHAFNASVTTPYWSLVNPESPTASRDVQFFNLPNGDFNHDGKVNGADYVVWRKTDGTQLGYNAWRSHFGVGTGAGAALSSDVASVPEPVSMVLIALGLVGLGLNRRPRCLPPCA